MKKERNRKIFHPLSISSFHKELRKALRPPRYPRNEITFPFYVSKIIDSRTPADTKPIIRSIKGLRWFFSTGASREGDWLLTRNRSRYRTNFFKSSATRTYQGARGSGSILNYDTSSLSTWVSTIYSVFPTRLLPEFYYRFHSFNIGHVPLAYRRFFVRCVRFHMYIYSVVPSGVCAE